MNVRTIREFNNRTGALGVCDDPRITDGPAPPTDTDMDGMPDCWETHMGFNPNDASDNKDDHDADEYTNIEEYINDLALDWVGDLPHNGDLEDGCPTDVENASLTSTKALSIRINPNPFTSGVVRINLQGYQYKDGMVQILNSRGQVILKRPLKAQMHWNGRDSKGSPVAPGIYLVRVNTNKSSAIQKKMIVIP
jgi:hypothetical protein